MKLKNLFETVLTESINYDSIMQIVYDLYDSIIDIHKLYNIPYNKKAMETILFEIKELPRADLKINILLYTRAFLLFDILNHLVSNLPNRIVISEYVEDMKDLLNDPDILNSNNKMVQASINHARLSIKAAKMYEEYTRRVGLIYKPPIDLIDQINHYISLPVKKIQDYRVAPYENPKNYLKIFEQYEQEWKEEIGDDAQWIPFGNEKVVMDFGDGFAWYDLENASCDAEGGAMGHCGNAPSADDPNQTIYSLREKKNVNGDIFVRPVCTFILHKDIKMFGEMKGRGNDKPADRYHKYIVPLIMSNEIEGLLGGGYMPESNFKITDLPNWESLVQQKPKLMEINDYLDRFGIDSHVKSVFMQKLTMSNVTETDPPVIYVELNEVSGSFPSEVLNVINGDNYFDRYISYYDSGEHDVINALHSATTLEQDNILIQYANSFLDEEDLQYDLVDEVNDFHSAIELIMENDDEFIDDIRNFYISARESSLIKELESAVNDYLEEGPEESYFSVDFEDGGYFRFDSSDVFVNWVYYENRESYDVEFDLNGLVHEYFRNTRDGEIIEAISLDSTSWPDFDFDYDTPFDEDYFKSEVSEYIDIISRKI